MYLYVCIFKKKQKKTITHIHSENKYIHIKYWDTKKNNILFGYLQNFYC